MTTPATAPLLEMHHISKQYGELWANQDIHLSVHKGTIHALCGENGAGKSTLMKILFGLEQADSLDKLHPARILYQGKALKIRSPQDAILAGIGMVPQHFSLVEPLTAVDNLILGVEPIKNGLIDRTGAQQVAERLAGTLLRIPWGEPVERLPVGLKQRLEILKLLFRNAELLIFDEPTAVLAPAETDTFFSLLQHLKAEGKTCILITHKLDDILLHCDEVTVLRQGRQVGHLPVAELSKEKLTQMMVGRQISPLIREPVHRGDLIVEMRDVQSKLNSLQVSLELHQGEIVGIAGIDGNGQQAVIDILLGLQPYSGIIKYCGTAWPHTPHAIRTHTNLGYIGEDRHSQSLWLSASLAKNCAIGFSSSLSPLGFFTKRRQHQHAEALLSAYPIAFQSLEQPIRELSGGNQQKVIFARELARKPKLLIACQPTRGVDIGATEFIWQQLLALRNSAAILLISSDLDELMLLCDRLLVINEGTLTNEFSGPHYHRETIGRAMLSKTHADSAGEAV